MVEPKFRTVSVDIETHFKLAVLADHAYRSIPGQVRFLVEQEEARQAEKRKQVEPITAMEGQ